MDPCFGEGLESTPHRFPAANSQDFTPVTGPGVPDGLFVRLGKPSLATILLVVTSLIALLSFALPSHAQSPGAQNARPLITQNIDESKLAVLAGNMRPEARAANDRGSVAHNLMLEHLLLQLKRPAEQETALKALIDDLHNPESANYHHWLTAAEFGERFGLAQQDVDTITSWLTWRGFQVNFVYPSRVIIDFSGTAGQVMQAFHTEIHHLEVNGKSHIANVSEPHIPSALAPAIAGVVSLHDFRPHPMQQVNAYRQRHRCNRNNHFDYYRNFRQLDSHDVRQPYRQCGSASAGLHSERLAKLVNDCAGRSRRKHNDYCDAGERI